MQQPLYEQIFRQLLAEIEAGRLRPGDRVPSETQLAAQYHVSRITSKRALEKLAQAGLIERARGRGSFVARSQVETLRSQPAAAGAGAGDRVRRGLVAFLLPDFSETYGSRLIRTIERRLRNYDLHLVLFRTEGSRDLEEKALDACLALDVDGIIVFPVYGEYYNERLLRLVLNRFPVVLVDRYLRGIPVTTVATDNRQAAADLTEHLIGLGHRRIVFVTPPAAGTSSIEDRIQGVTTTMASHGLPFGAADVLPLYCTLPGAFDPTPDEVARDEEAVRRYVQEHPDVTAFIACEYALALLVEHTLWHMGYKVPEEYSVACFDSGRLPIIEPYLTHVLQDEETIGQLAVDLLWAQLEGREESPLFHTMRYTVLAGCSTGPASAAGADGAHGFDGAAAAAPAFLIQEKL